MARHRCGLCGATLSGAEGATCIDVYACDRRRREYGDASERVLYDAAQAEPPWADPAEPF